MHEDFDKLPGEKTLSSDGREMKTFANGDKVVKRPREKDKSPTLEVQAGDGAKEKVKVRYK